MMDDQSTHDRALTEPGPDAGQGSAGTAADGQGPGAAGVPAPVLSADAVEADAAEPAGSARQDAGRQDAGRQDAETPAAEGQDAGRSAPKKAKNRSFWREMPVLVIIALVIALVIKSFVVQAFFIPSPSMEHTLNVGDKVLVNKLVYHFRSIQPGDIVVFNGVGSWDPLPPAAKASSDPVVRLYDAAVLPLFRSIAGLFGTAPGQQDYIKRVIGVPGDHVACCTASGLVTVNGVPLHETSYLYPGNKPSLIRFSIIVPPGQLWVMGDYRYVSYDSRLHRGDPGNGTIPESQVVGRAFMIVWPPSRWRILPIPATFGQPGITSPAAAAALGHAPASHAALASVTVPVRPAAPFLPLELGFAMAVPVTWIQRRARRLVRGRRWRRPPR
jgi:signal peptidase I